MADGAGWSLTESDPGVFTGLLHELGVRGLEVEELWGLDESLLQELNPIHAFIFLFKWIGNADAAKMDGELKEPDGSFYFAHQVINNACASIALLNAVLNIQDPKVQLGEELSNLQAFSDGLDAETRGWTISNSEKIREGKPACSPHIPQQLHNSFARSDPFHLEEHRPQDESEDAYHFIAYLPIDGVLYELDGLKNKPVSHGKIPEGKEWTGLAREVLERRISTHPPGEVMFNLMCVTSRRAHLKHQLADLEQKASAGNEGAVAKMLDVKERLEGIEERVKDWEVENTLRRHNYIGLAHALLVELAKQGKLQPQIEAAKVKMKQRNEEKKAKGMDVMEED
ncbi:hypothetical protein JCM11641_008129 [Rhodosporidiobolus odoratus]